jgi:hypothetical protein
MRRSLIAVLALAGALGVTSPAHAGCCDDLLNCVETVVTGGLSCQVETIVDTVKSLEQNVTNLAQALRSEANTIVVEDRNAVVISGDDLAAIGLQSVAELESAATTTGKLANAPLHVAATDNPLADPTAVRSTMKQADAYVQGLKSKQGLLLRDINSARALAVAALARHERTALQMMNDTALEPLIVLGESLDDLLKHPEFLFDPSAQVDADMALVSREIPALINRINSEMLAEATGDLAAVRPAVQQLQDFGAVASSIASSMQRLSRSGTQADLDALRRLVPGALAPGVQASYGVMLPQGVSGNHEAVTRAFARTQPENLATSAKHKARVTDITGSWEAINARRTSSRPDPAYVQRVEHDFIVRFRGKSASEIDKQKRVLVQEAKTRFANNPKMQQKVIDYIEGHAHP